MTLEFRIHFIADAMITQDEPCKEVLKRQSKSISSTQSDGVAEFK